MTHWSKRSLFVLCAVQFPMQLHSLGSSRSSFEPIRSAALRRQAEERKRVQLAWLDTRQLCVRLHRNGTKKDASYIWHILVGGYTHSSGTTAQQIQQPNMMHVFLFLVPVTKNEDAFLVLVIALCLNAVPDGFDPQAQSSLC